MERRITVIGSSNVDMIMQLERLPAVGETVLGGTFLQTFGGKGANQAVAAARAGGHVTFLTGVGDDHYGRTALENFRQDGINMDHALIAAGVPTGTALVMFDQQGDNYLAVASGANYALQPHHIEACEPLLAESAMIVTQMEIPDATLLRVLELAAKHEVAVLHNFAPARVGAIPISDHLTGLVVNEVEATALTGLPVDEVAQAIHAAEALRAQGPEFVLVTLGSEGVVVASVMGSFHLPAFSVTPVDTTAAGDVFCGAFAVALTEDKTLVEAVRFANAASALSVTRLGAQPSIPHREEIEAFLRQH